MWDGGEEPANALNRIAANSSSVPACKCVTDSSLWNLPLEFSGAAVPAGRKMRKELRIVAARGSKQTESRSVGAPRQQSLIPYATLLSRHPA
jgi:hypothetical protein